MWSSLQLTTGQPLLRREVSSLKRGWICLFISLIIVSQTELTINAKRQRLCDLHCIGEMGRALQLSSSATFVIVVFAISLLILAGVLSYIYFRGSSGRKRGDDTIIAFNNYRKSHLILLVDDDSPAGPRYKTFYARSSLIDSESESFTSIKISPSCPTVFGHEMDAEGIIKVVLTPPTPAKRKRRKSLIDYGSEDSEDLPAYN